MTYMENNINGRRPEWKTTTVKYNLCGRQHNLKTTLMDDHINGRKLQWTTTQLKRTLIEDNFKTRRPQ